MKTDFFAILLKVTAGVALVGGLLILIAALADPVFILTLSVVLGVVSTGLGLAIFLSKDPDSPRGRWHKEVRQYRQSQRRQRRGITGN
ncbi:hypothetical protein [Hymenobacter guriensis]|uniref:DUF4133 domain-containing protein n=1 Tax=Hymenobacter guriensis TaxID=2793065 RepID=A0ABS0L8N1_9BACT|nr:hypothetical protein [Hymenobacter guriensis]MBG8556446.1 hypothetical protein [Hymenobacter guriensis]